MRKNRAVFTGLAAALVLVACGGGGSTGAGSPTSTPPEATPSVSTPTDATHAAQPGEPALIAVPGYAYENDATLTKLMRQKIGQLDGFKRFSVHGVTEDGSQIGMLVLLQAKPAYQQAVESGTVDPIEPPPGLGASQSTIARERVLTVGAAPSDTAWIWYHDGTLSQFFQGSAASRKEAVNFVEAYLHEANG